MNILAEADLVSLQDGNSRNTAHGLSPGVDPEIKVPTAMLAVLGAVRSARCMQSTSLKNHSSEETQTGFAAAVRTGERALFLLKEVRKSSWF